MGYGRSDPTRRQFLTLGGAAAAASLMPLPGLAALPRGEPLHGLSAFGELGYPPDFERFDYGNPDAPKGGTFNFQPPNWAFNQSPQSFDTLNSFVLRGTGPLRAELAHDSLMVRALDEPDAVYGLLAESVTISPDGNRFTFHLRPEARWHDGKPVTADDLVATYTLFRSPEAHPALSQPLNELVEAIAENDRTFTLVYSGRQSDRAILNAATYPVVQKAHFDNHPFDGSQMIAPAGSGPYAVSRFEAGVFVEYGRVDDYWAADLPVNRGFSHFDRIRIDYYRERQSAFEAFKKGSTLYREEFTSKVWATEYDFPALNEGRIVKRTFPREKYAAMQAWAVNLRRERLADRRVREAIASCFDFEWTREILFYGAYERSQSPFEGSDFVATGLPGADELALLEPWRGQIPDEAFGEAVVQPVSDGSGRDRALLANAARLLRDAGWRNDSGLLVNDKGKTLTLEMMVRDEVFVRVNQPFVENMRAIGIDATIRLVDPSQFEARLRDFDFDMVGTARSLGATPTGESLELLFSSRAAATKGGDNLPGTADPAVDHLIALAGEAKDRGEYTIVMRALDRVLRARRDWIPNWHAANHRVAYWDMFGFSENKPDYGFPVERLWWYDKDKAKAIGRA
ncbi:MAG: extracellular solute-binding protein [Notoacmeibacter sp.]|nr:extracellular solute-binding protein [Notoacmeibacter sp.]